MSQNVVNQLETNPEIQKWLSEYANKRTQRYMFLRLRDFLTSIDISINEFMKLSTKEAKHYVLKYQAIEKEKGTKNNTVLSNITAPRALFKYLEKPMKFGRGRLIKSQKAQNRHRFSNGDLGKMFDVAPIRGKAMIATASSLGWAMSDFRALDRQKIESLIARAKENDEKFIFFKTERKKTGAKTLGVLNPLAIEWLSKWLSQSDGIKVFDLSHDQINKDLQNFAEQAQIHTVGNVSFHAFRGWVMSSLVKAGFSEFETKYIVGKTIPLSDETYLNLEESVKEKYVKAYEKFLSIKKYEDLEKNAEIEDLKKAMQQLESENSARRTRIDLLQEQITDLKLRTKSALTESAKKIKEMADEAEKALREQAEKQKQNYERLLKEVEKSEQRYQLLQAEIKKLAKS